MIALKTIQTCFTPTRETLSHTRRLTVTRKKNPTIYLCKSKDDDDSEATPPEGDTRKQELLARIMMLQTQKVRLTDYLDERSTYLTQFAEEANAEMDQIGEDALKGLDEASARIMENIESRMQAFEESVELNKEEIESNDKKLIDFEGQIENDKNEGMFFKNLGKRAPVDKERAMIETEKIKDLTKESAGSITRRNIYLALMGLLIVGFVDGLISSPSDWRKVAALGLILVALFSQFIHEQRLLSAKESMEKKQCEEEKK